MSAILLRSILALRLSGTLPKCHAHLKRTSSIMPLNGTPAAFVRHRSDSSMRCMPTIRAFAAQSSSDSVGGGGGSGGTWRGLWLTLLQHLHADGHFAVSDPGVTLENIEADKGAVKRAVLSFARQRADILRTLTPRHVKSLIAAGVPADQADRKTKNAYRRLHASYIQEMDLPPGDGGPADLQDVLRMVLAAAHTKEVSSNDAMGLSAGMVLDEILVAAKSTSGAPGELSEKAKNIARMRSGGAGSVPGKDA